MTDNGNANTIGDLIRSLFGFLNRGVYFLLGIMYQIFFNVASAQLFESETIKNFYGRIQLIIGVFMVFKLAVSILQGIMSPDQFSDPKSGFGNFITRVVVALALLTVLVPINVPDVENANSFEKYINNNGLLFGTLYSLQERILSNNTLGRLILGTTDEATSTSSADDSGMSEADRQTAMLERSSRIFASTILKGFLRINLLPTEIRESDSETDSQNWYCGANLSGTASEALQAYMQLDIDPSTLLSDEVLHADCEINDNILTSLANGASNIPIIGALFENFGGNSRYVFWFDGFFALIVGIVFLVILVGFTVDIAIRSIKLAILRLIAPIPVISYIEPKSSKDGGMFSSWVKALTSTYLDLFLRLAIVYFVIFLIQDMIVNGFVINEAGGMVGIISFIFIMLGLFFFAKMAPKFIKDALGLKGAGMSNIGLSGMLGGIGALVGGGGIKGAGAAMITGATGAAEAAAQGKPAPPAWQTGSDLAAQIRTGDPKAKGGVVNNLTDRLMRGASINAARRYGVTAGSVNAAKSRMYAAQDDAARAKDQYERFMRGQLGAEERAVLQGDQDFVNSVQNYENDGYGRQEAYRKALEDRMFSRQSAAGKAKSDYEKASKFADSHRISTSFEEEHRPSIKESIQSPYRAARTVATNIHNDGIVGGVRESVQGRMAENRGEHQSLVDRVAGDNMWGSDANSDGGGNRVVDNPWMPGGPPPGP